MKSCVQGKKKQKIHIKRGDLAHVITGEHRGQSGKVLQVLVAQCRVIIEGVNIRKKSVRPSQINPQGGFQEKEYPLHISNVKKITLEEAKEKAKEKSKESAKKNGKTK